MWNAQWYGGHHWLGYSLLFSPLAATLGPRLAGVLACVVAVALFGVVTRGATPDRRRAALATWQFAAAVTSNVVIGRMPFTVGIALAVGAWLAGGLVLAAIFPGGGVDRFAPTAFRPMLAVSAAAIALLDTRRRTVAAAAGALPGHADRGLRGPDAVGPERVAWLPAVRAAAEARRDPSTQAAFQGEAERILAPRPGERVEVVLTLNHREAAHLAPTLPLARGWERQLDQRTNPLFYDGRPLTAARYFGWLRERGIRWVALPAAPLDTRRNLRRPCWPADCATWSRSTPRRAGGSGGCAERCRPPTGRDA